MEAGDVIHQFCEEIFHRVSQYNTRRLKSSTSSTTHLCIVTDQCWGGVAGIICPRYHPL